MAAFATGALAGEPTQVERVQAALDAWLAERAPSEKVTGIAAYVSFGETGPAIEAFAGKVGRAPDAKPVNQDALYQMGSTSKSFTVAVVLQLEAAGKALDRRRARQMAAGISGVEGRDHPPPARHDQRHPQLFGNQMDVAGWAKEPMRAFKLKDLADAAYPSATNPLPGNNGYHYSNTNYILAAMIAEKASGKPFSDLVHELVIRPHGLYETYSSPAPIPKSVTSSAWRTAISRTERARPISRIARYRGTHRSSDGICASRACPGCSPPAALSQVLATLTVGCARSSAEKSCRPKQQKEWTELISTKTGRPIYDRFR